jgi:hypothetical protein
MNTLRAKRQAARSCAWNLRLEGTRGDVAPSFIAMSINIALYCPMKGILPGLLHLAQFRHLLGNVRDHLPRVGSHRLRLSEAQHPHGP